MIDKTNLIPTVLEKLKKLPRGNALDMRTYKRNRSVLFVRLSSRDFRIIQNGYEYREHRVPLDKMGKFLKSILKKEFPRSNKIRLYDLGEFDQLAPPGQDRKII